VSSKQIIGRTAPADLRRPVYSFPSGSLGTRINSLVLEDNLMSIFERLFRGSARKLLEQMYSDTNVIQMAIATKLFSLYEPQYGHDRALTLAAAVANKLFAKVSPVHAKDDLVLAEELANRLLLTDQEIRYAALMSCRAKLLLEAARNSEEKWQVWDTIQWMAGVWNLPQEEAEPTLIRQIAIALHKKYLQKTE
jgi:hypothetical protein